MTKIILPNARQINNLIEYNISYPEPIRPQAEIRTLSVSGILFAKDKETGRLYSYDNGGLRYSTDDGVLFTKFWDTTDKENIGTILSAKRLSNGRILVVISRVGQILELWASDLAEDSTKTFTKVHDFQYGNPLNTWGWDTRTESVLLMSEYKSTPDATDGTNARFAYMSLDNGLTWQQIFEGPSNKMFHIHSIGYDPYHNTIYIVSGDSVYSNLHYSYDFGKTWKKVWEDDGSMPTQFLTIIAMPHCVLFGSDGSPDGIFRLDKNWRKGEYHTIVPEDIKCAYRIDPRNDGTFYQIVHSPLYIDGAYYFATWTSLSVETQAYIVGTKDGYHFYDLFVSKPLSYANFGIRSLFTDGKELIGSWRDGVGSNDMIKLSLPTWQKL